MNKKIICWIWIAAAVLMFWCGCYAEVYNDPDMCFITDAGGWIRDIVNIYEIRASDANLYEYESFSALAFSGELDKAAFDISGNPLKPYDMVRVYFDRTFHSNEEIVDGGICVTMNAVMDPDNIDPELFGRYSELKYSVVGNDRKMRSDILIWANTAGKEIPIDGIYLKMDLPDEYDSKNISRFGAVFNYMTQYVYEIRESGLDFRQLLSGMDTDVSGRFKERTTRQITGRGYSVGLIADPSFVFLVITDTDTVLFRDSDSVIRYYEKVTGII